ncbi:hypothetical protein NEAUS04_1852 [Nematocida ausubeli]|uniref:Protein-S-isoprenylcysteine O-methyltransferase n=1 Tax=Nematocida ausubeli (strain ATCC PRA-371 / ERTm2) TaxID=1913371 RepID=H8ZEP6_NEMA1|nr:hypothetical protein NERG_02067 [Nematocida ausubeli]KAI5163966.1 hypothetical protein NEAUS04_1852 [Nematocida ausubeli]
MNRETIVVFALGMIFYHGVYSAANEKGLKIASVCALILFFHKAVFNIHMQELLRKMANSKGPALSGALLFIFTLAIIESVIMYMIHPFLPGTLVYLLERLGGVIILASLLFIFSSIWILSKNDIAECVYIDQGIYAYIRHPYYLGLFLLYVGICLTLGNICSIVVSLFALKDRVIEYINEEEALLIEKHKSYTKYRERVYSGMPNILVNPAISTESFISSCMPSK